MNIVSLKECCKKEINCFDCGVKELNNYFINYAKQNENNNIGRTFVLKDNGRILGFYTLCTSSIAQNELPTKYQKLLPKYPIPCIRLARLAVDKHHQNNFYGHILLKDAFTKILVISKKVGISFVLVDAKPTSKKFYLKFGFISIPKNELTMILPLETIILALN